MTVVYIETIPTLAQPGMRGGKEKDGKEDVVARLSEHVISSVLAPFKRVEEIDRRQSSCIPGKFAHRVPRILTDGI